MGTAHIFKAQPFTTKKIRKVEDGKSVPCPVIYIDFSKIDMDALTCGKKFKHKLTGILINIAKVHGLQIEDELDFDIVRLIDDMEQKHNLLVKILVSEYDEPLSSAILNKATEKQLISILLTFFKQIKACAEKLRLVLLNGYLKTPFFKDLAFDREYTSILDFRIEDF